MTQLNEKQPSDINNKQPQPLILASHVASLFEVPVLISIKNGKYYAELRSGTSNEDIIKQLISKAYREEPVIVKLKFTDMFKSITNCINKGLIVKDEKTGQFIFTF